MDVRQRNPKEEKGDDKEEILQLPFQSEASKRTENSPSERVAASSLKLWWVGPLVFVLELVAQMGWTFMS